MVYQPFKDISKMKQLADEDDDEINFDKTLNIKVPSIKINNVRPAISIRINQQPISPKLGQYNTV